MKGKELFWMTVLTILCIACFPVNPLVLTGVIEPGYFLSLTIIGWVIWSIGMVLVMAPIIIFPWRGGVARGKSFVNTTRLVDSGIYALVRHPQYLGGILALFIANMLFYPHWIFIVLGIPGIVITYLSSFKEERDLIERFGRDYADYMQRVPRMNLVLGIIRVLRRKSDRRS